MLERAGVSMATAAAGAVAALSGFAADQATRFTSCSCSDSVEYYEKPLMWQGKSRKCEDGKFAPRFDGLRFIETLVTGHR